MVGWLACWLVGCLADWSVGWFDWLAGWLVWLAGWLVGSEGLGLRWDLSWAAEKEVVPSVCSESCACAGSPREAWVPGSVRRLRGGPGGSDRGLVGLGCRARLWGKWSSVMASPKVTAACQYPGRRMARSRRKKKQEDSMAGSSMAATTAKTRSTLYFPTLV